MGAVVSEFCSVDVPTITVGLPVFNGGGLLKMAVLSLINQSFQNWELLVVDDGSTDGCIDSLVKIADPRVIVTRDGVNKGLSTRLNQAVSLARGKYFARMDHDDICHPDRLARQISFLEDHPDVDLLATQCLTIDEISRLTGRLPYAINHADICHQPWRGFYMAHPSWMGKTEWFRRNAYKEPAPYCCEDQELLLRAHYSSCYYTLPEYLLAYRIRTHTPWKRQLRTRVSMGKMKVRHFLDRQELVNALFSGLIELARVGYDVSKEIRHRISLTTKVGHCSMLTPEERQEWEALIAQIKVSAERSNSN